MMKEKKKTEYITRGEFWVIFSTMMGIILVILGWLLVMTSENNANTTNRMDGIIDRMGYIQSDVAQIKIILQYEQSISQN